MEPKVIEEAIKSYLEAKLDTDLMSVEIETPHAPETYKLANHGCIVIAWNSSGYIESGAAPNKTEMGQIKRRPYLKDMEFVISVGSESYRGEQYSLMEILDKIESLLTNYDLTGCDPLAPIAISQPMNVSNVWWSQLRIKTKVIIDIKPHE